MRYAKDHKDASRQRLIELGGSHAKKHGFNESGVASLAASAGVTTGALYKHFDGKAELFAALIAAELIYERSIYPVAEDAFKHPLTHEVALGAQLTAARRARHAAVAEAIAAMEAANG